MNTPTYKDGLPENLEGASLDALEWLIVIHRLMKTGRISSLYSDLPEHTKRIEGCISELQKRGIGKIEPLYLAPDEDTDGIFPGHKNRIV